MIGVIAGWTVNHPVNQSQELPSGQALSKVFFRNLHEKGYFLSFRNSLRLK
jgi:hypothetical protein